MTSIRFHFRPSTVRGSDEGRLFVRLIHKRRSGTIPTGYILKAEEWNEDTGTITLPEANPGRHRYLEDLKGKLAEIRKLLDASISQYSLRGDYEVEDIVKGYIRTPEGDKFRDYCVLLQHRLLDNGQVRTARAYRSAIKSFQTFMDESGFTLRNFDGKILKRYETWMLERSLMMNTVSFYLRNLRAIYNKAVRDEIIPDKMQKPFKEVYTGVYKTRHRALSEEQLNSLSSLEKHLDGKISRNETTGNIRQLEMNIKLKRTLDYFLFCFHARGMSYVDMAYLKKSEIVGDTILYKRKKTGRFLEVKITGPMQRIIERYRFLTTDSPYVFPIIVPGRGAERRQYENGLNLQNRLLGELSRMAGIGEKVTTHVSRHTWASIAKFHKVDIAVISEALGHSSLAVTDIYLASFGRSVMDGVSDKVSGVIKTGKKAA